MQDLIVGNGVLVTLGTDNKILPQGAVAVRDGRILEVGATSDFLGRYPGARFLDAGGRLIMPGFVNAHMHFYSSFARGMGLPGFAPKNFTDVLQGLWWKLDRALNLDDVRSSAEVALVECIRKGTTTIVDHHASPYAVEGSLDQVATACLEAGVRASLCYEVSDRDGDKIATQGLDENARFLERCATTPELAGVLGGTVGLHASFTLHDATLDKAAGVAARYQAPVHIHMAEDRADVTESVARYGARPMARLQRAGLLERPALLAHCIHLEDAEYEQIRDTGSWALHNPQSNLNNAVGTAPIPRMLGMGVQVALGSDGMTSNMLEELRAASLVHKLGAGPGGGIDFGGLYTMALVNNARLASSLLGIEVGHLTPGAAGDVVVLDYRPYTPLNADTFLGHLVFGILTAPVATTIAQGRVLMHEHQILAVDEASINARAMELAQRCWKRVSQVS